MSEKCFADMTGIGQICPCENMLERDKTGQQDLSQLSHDIHSQNDSYMQMYDNCNSSSLNGIKPLFDYVDSSMACSNLHCRPHAYQESDNFILSSMQEAPPMAVGSYHGEYPEYTQRSVSNFEPSNKEMYYALCREPVLSQNVPRELSTFPDQSNLSRNNTSKRMMIANVPKSKTSQQTHTSKLPEGNRIPVDTTLHAEPQSLWTQNPTFSGNSNESPEFVSPIGEQVPKRYREYEETSEVCDPEMPPLIHVSDMFNTEGTVKEQLEYIQSVNTSQSMRTTLPPPPPLLHMRDIPKDILNQLTRNSLKNDKTITKSAGPASDYNSYEMMPGKAEELNPNQRASTLTNTLPYPKINRRIDRLSYLKNTTLNEMDILYVTCKICGKSTATLREIRKHFKDFHNKEPRAVELVIEYSFRGKKKLEYYNQSICDYSKDKHFENFQLLSSNSHKPKQGNTVNFKCKQSNNGTKEETLSQQSRKERFIRYHSRHDPEKKLNEKPELTNVTDHGYQNDRSPVSSNIIKALHTIIERGIRDTPTSLTSEQTIITDDRANCHFSNTSLCVEPPRSGTEIPVCDQRKEYIDDVNNKCVLDNQNSCDVSAGQTQLIVLSEGQLFDTLQTLQYDQHGRKDYSGNEYALLHASPFYIIDQHKGLTRHTCPSMDSCGWITLAGVRDQVVLQHDPTTSSDIKMPGEVRKTKPLNKTLGEEKEESVREKKEVTIKDVFQMTVSQYNKLDSFTDKEFFEPANGVDMSLNNNANEVHNKILPDMEITAKCILNMKETDTPELSSNFTQCVDAALDLSETPTHGETFKSRFIEQSSSEDKEQTHQLNGDGNQAHQSNTREDPKTADMYKFTFHEKDDSSSSDLYDEEGVDLLVVQSFSHNINSKKFNSEKAKSVYQFVKNKEQSIDIHTTDDITNRNNRKRKRGDMERHSEHSKVYRSKDIKGERYKIGLENHDQTMVPEKLSKNDIQSGHAMNNSKIILKISLKKPFKILAPDVETKD